MYGIETNNTHIVLCLDKWTGKKETNNTDLATNKIITIGKKYIINIYKFEVFWKSCFSVGLKGYISLAHSQIFPILSACVY